MNTSWRETERFARLKATYERLRKSVYKGLEGVVKIGGSKPGPTIGITVCTHGNEPAGLAAAEYLLNEVLPQKDQLSGTIYIVLNNIRATEIYFSAKNEEEALRARATEANMNRLPRESLSSSADKRYEAVRARLLKLIFAEFDIGLDIHSTMQDSGPMIITYDGDFPTELIRGMPGVLLSNIDAVQVGVPISSLYGSGRPSSKRFGIEAGMHEKDSTFDTAVACVKILLGNAGVFGSRKEIKTPAAYDEYVVVSSIVFPSESYTLVRPFRNYEFVPKGTVLARGNGPEIIAEEDSHTLFGGKVKPHSLEEEAVFLLKPKKVRTIN